MKRCISCGAEIADASTFCAVCGESQAESYFKAPTDLDGFDQAAPISPQPNTYNQATPQPYPYDQAAPQSYPYNQAAPQSYPYNQTVPQPNTYNQTVPQPNIYNQAVPQPNTYNQTVPQPYPYNQPAPQPYPQPAPYPKRTGAAAPKVNPKLLALIASVAVALIAIITIVAIILSSRSGASSPEQLVSKLESALNRGNSNALLDLYPDCIRQQETYDINTGMERLTQYTNYRFALEVYQIEPRPEKIQEYASELSYKSGQYVEVQDACKVRVRIYITLAGKSETDKESLDLVKINGRWYMTSFF